MLLGDRTLTLFGLAPDDYLLAVDSTSRTGNVQLSVSCRPWAPAAVACGQTLSAVTSTASDLDGYTCDPRPLNGGEA